MTKQKWVRNLLLVMALSLAWLVSSRVLAQGSFSIPFWSVDAGGATLSGAPFTLEATAGQADADVLAGGEFTLYGGFWSVEQTTSDPEHRVFMPALEAP
jgi:hypothetical protein